MGNSLSKEECKRLSKKVSEKFTEIMKRFFGKADLQDMTDIAAISYFKAYDCELRENKIYKGDKEIGELGHVKYDGNKLDIRVKWYTPIHFIMCDIDINKTTEVTKEKKK